uniref:Uncharacterized protein n=1 Tax=Avena sativa TaxID=4498 RepID=A0ACD5WQW1_AVESA
MTPMEVALLSAVMKPAANKLVSLIGSEFVSIVGVTKDLCELRDLFGDITAWLSAVVVRTEATSSSPHWLKQLKAVVNDFDDLLYRLEADKHKADSACENHVMANWFCTKPKPILSHTKMVQEIKEIKKRFAKIVRQRTEFNAIANSTLVTNHVQPTHKTIGEMSILTNTTYVIGRDEVKYSIISVLKEADIQERISIISIVGLGGSGKTTLAKYICQDGKIGKHFEVVYWVHVSQEFNVEKLLGKLFESVSDEKSELHTFQHMSRKISQKLSARKFLLVLDDVWNEDKHDWEQFEQHLNSGAPGSKILLTTRDKNVAEVVESVEVVNLAVLSDDDSWKLFQQSSGWAEEGLDSEFIEVGKDIVKKCAGMPIAIKSLAGNLQGKRDIKEWQSLRDSNLLSNKDIQHRVLESLKLSYFHLTDDLKQCCVLCCIFPKGYSINKEHLISQWITHGFVTPSDGSRQQEDIGNDYFHSLLNISFLQDLVEDYHTGRVIVTCKMHDLVHDLSRQILQDEIFLTPMKSTNDHNQMCRYLSLAPCYEKVESKLFSKLRALFLTGRGNFATDKPIKKGYCVRSIILEDIWETSVPLFISKFEYLGYLRISNSRCQELPEAIMGCWNLQAIHVIECFRFATLPESIGKLRKLKTLELSETMDLESLPQSIGDCHNLQSLHLDRCLSLNNVPESLCKNDNLQLLNIIDCYSLQHLPSKTFGLLRNLEKINLSKSASLEVLPDSFASDQLHTLKLSGLTNLAVLPQSITSLSKLERLDLQGCRGLVELPEGIVNLKRLVVLNLQGCSRLLGLPAGFGRLTRLETLGLFVIGESSDHARISELGSLDRLSGTLELSIVKDPDDAEKAYLKRKSNIHELELLFRNMDTEIEQEAGMEQETAVLNALEPPYEIKVMRIWNYKGLHLPGWLTKKTHWSNKFEKIVDLPHFPLLTRMSLGSLPKMMHLTGLVHLPSLQSLSLSDIDTLESINIGPFPSLTSLSIDSMPGSLELTTTRAVLGGETICDGEETQCCFPCLSELYIHGCPKLNVNPCFPTSLKRLTLENSIVWPVHPQADNLESLSCGNSNWVSSCLTLVNKPEIAIPSCTCDWEFLQNLRALSFLKITRRNEELTQLPESMRSLTTLKQLIIHQCRGLRLLPECLGELGSLQKIEITDCKNLSGLPEIRLGGLRSLILSRLPRLSHLPDSMRGYTSLQELNISGCDALQQLPEGLGELPSLRRLSIGKLPVYITATPESLQGLTSLRYLGIYNCDALHQLPDKLGELHFLTELHIEKLPSLTCLPESMQSLTSLHSLSIIDCDALTSLPESTEQLSALMTGKHRMTRRYKRGAENDWLLISHLRHVETRV